MDEKVLLNVEINAREALDSYVKIKQRIDELRSSQKKLKEAGKEGSQAYIELEQQIKALNTRSQEYQKTIQQTIKQENEQQGSLQQLKWQLSLATQEYNKMSEEMRKSDAGLQKQKEIVGLTSALNEAEQGLLNFHRQVGNYSLVAKDLASEMKMLKDQLVGMADAGLQNTQEFKDMRARVDEINKALNPFADELKGTQQQLKLLTDQMVEMKLRGEDNTDEYKKMSEEAAKLKDAIADVSEQINKAAGDTAQLQAASQSLALLTNTMSILDKTTGELGVLVPHLQEALKDLTMLTSMLTLAIQFQTAAQKQSLVYHYAELVVNQTHIKQLAKLRIEQIAETAAKSKSIVVTKAATAATAVWNAVLMANPVLLIVAAIAIATVAVVGLTIAFGKSATAQREAMKATEEYEAQARKTAEAISRINARSKKESDDISNSMRQEIVEMKKRGATEKEIAKFRLEKEQEIRDVELEASRQKQAENEKEIASKKKVLQAEIKYLATLSEGSKKFKEQKKKVDELRQSYLDLKSAQQDEKQNEKDILLKNIEAEQQAAEERKKLQRKNASDQAEIQKQAADNALKAQKQSEELALDIADASQAERFANSQKWEKTMFDANQAYEKRKLARQKKNGEITQQEYNNQLAKLAESERVFLEDQAANAKKEVLRQYKEVMSAVGQQTEQMLKKVDNTLASNLAAVSGQLGIDDEFKRQYDNLSALMDMYKQQQEEFEKTGLLVFNASGATMEADKKRFDEMQQKMFEYYRIERELKAQAEEEKTAIEQAAVDKRLARALKAIEDENALDLLDYTKTQEEKNNILIEQSKKRIEAYKKEVEAETDPKVRLELLKKIAEEENTMRELNLQNVQIAAGKELANVTLTAMQKFKIKEAYLKQELDAVRGNAEAEAEINAQLLENRQETLNAIADGISEWGGKAVDAANQISSLMSNIEQRQLDEFEEKQNKQKSALQDRLDAGLISQEEYDASVARLDAELEKKQKEIEIKQAKRNKAIALMEAAINIATAITKAVAESPMTGGLPGSAIAATLGAIQIATIAAEPLPKASRGALLQGPSHAQGGIPIEAEGGEAIINKRSTSRFLPLLSAINQAGGGVPLFANGGLVRQAQQQSQQLIDYRAFAEIMSKVQIRSQVAVTDINRGQANYVKVESLRSF